MLLSVVVVVEGAAFVSRSVGMRKPCLTFMKSAREDFYHEPHFSVTIAPAVDKMDRMLDCAQQGECSVEEMDRMIAGAFIFYLSRVIQDCVGDNHTQHLTYSYSL